MWIQFFLNSDFRFIPFSIFPKHLLWQPLSSNYSNLNSVPFCVSLESISPSQNERSRTSSEGGGGRGESGKRHGTVVRDRGGRQAARWSPDNPGTVAQCRYQGTLLENIYFLHLNCKLTFENWTVTIEDSNINTNVGFKSKFFLPKLSNFLKAALCNSFKTFFIAASKKEFITYM